MGLSGRETQLLSMAQSEIVRFGPVIWELPFLPLL